jgi:hypothetical protein
VLPHRLRLLIAISVLAACGTNGGTSDLLSSSRLALRELETASVHVDTSGDFDVSVPANDPASEPLLRITKTANSSFTIQPSCDASHGPDVTYELVVTADGREQPLEVDVANDPTINCFLYVEVPMPIADDETLACADVTGRGDLQIAASGSFVTRVVLLSGLPGAFPDDPPPMQSLVQDFPETYVQLFSSYIAGGVTNRVATYAVSSDGGLYEVNVSSSKQFAALAKAGLNVVAFASSTTDGTVDTFAGITACPAGGDCITTASIASPTDQTQFQWGGKIGGLGTWNHGHAIAGVGDGFCRGGVAGKCVASLNLDSSSNAVKVETYFAPAMLPSISDLTLLKFQFAERWSSSDDVILVDALVGPYDGAVSEMRTTGPTMVDSQYYGGVGSVATAPDGRVLLGTYGGVELVESTATGASYRLVDLVEAQSVRTRLYGVAVAPCLDAKGSMSGFAVATGTGVRVVRLPDAL